MANFIGPSSWGLSGAVVKKQSANMSADTGVFFNGQTYADSGLSMTYTPTASGNVCLSGHCITITTKQTQVQIVLGTQDYTPVLAVHLTKYITVATTLESWAIQFTSQHLMSNSTPIRQQGHQQLRLKLR